MAAQQPFLEELEAEEETGFDDDCDEPPAAPLTPGREDSVPGREDNVPIAATCDEAASPSIFLKKLVAIDQQPHEHQNALVGLSCLGLLTPILPAYLNDDLITVGCAILATLCSLFADWLYIGTFWNVIDRWVALGFGIYMFCLVAPQLRVLSVINLILLSGFLAFSRSSKTKAQWRLRHTVWHLVLAVDMPLFLVLGAYPMAEVDL